MQLGKIKILQFNKIGAKLHLEKDFFITTNPSSDFPCISFSLEIFFILLRFMAFWCCLKAFNLEDYYYISNWLFIFSLAWTIGLLVPSAPGGVGIFESFILLIIRDEMNNESLILALIAYRLIASVADIALPIILTFYRYMCRLNNRTDRHIKLE